ncbi:MAG: phosphotransferase [Candidatus Acidiferrales bacterium]
MTSHLTATDAYRLIILRRDATEILLSQKEAGWGLPRVEVQKQQRIAEQLTAEIRKGWGLEAYCLFVASSGASGLTGEAACGVLECVKHNERAPAGTYWMPVNVAADCSDAEEAATIRDAFAELASYIAGEKPGPFARPGWLRELFQWAYEQTAPLGLRFTGNFRQFNASPTFSLLRLDTGGAALWFKATGKPNAHELPVTLLLADLFPNHVPRILGVHNSWNGWLSAEAEGIPLDELTECSAWERAAGALAELQIESIGRATKLVDGKCKDLRLLESAKRIDPFLVRMKEFMRVQEKSSPAPLAAAEIASLGEGLRDSFSLLQSFGLPDTLGHLDCNPGNLVVSQERCVFLDWAEACVTNPLITFEYLRRHMTRCGIEEPGADSRITGAYLRPWASFFSPDDFRRAIATAPPVAVFIHAIAGEAWRTLDPLANPALAAYFRSLTRRMYRDAVLAMERSEPCLS